MNLTDHSTETLLRMALTGGDDELDSAAALAMKCVAEDLLMVENATKADDAIDYDYAPVIHRIAMRAELAAELARRELAAAKESGTHRTAEKAGLQ
ncbi:MAG TPA: hypothetical protein VK550_13520 [Polyangiaceae bacterium]|nr:hypothetical protein [Polyangiaceae bacterium]